MTALWVAVGALAVLSVVEGIAIVALAREVGLLSRRLPPAPALESTEGPAIGATIPTLALHDLRTGEERVITPQGEKGRVLVFLSTRCGACRQLLQEMDGVVRDWPDREVVPILSGPLREARDMAAKAAYGGPATQDEGEAMRAVAIVTTPRALIVDEAGAVVARGVVNTREMISSLIQGHLHHADAAVWVEGDQVEVTR